LLLTGPEGTGKAAFASLLAQSLLCVATSQDGLPCGACRSCKLFTARSHPNFLVVEPEEGGATIKIDQIRDLIARLMLAASGADGARVALIRPADAMNRNAANSLLKTLEEPPLGTVLVLVAHQLAALPVTVRSRCQCISFNGCGAEKSAWLREQLHCGIDPAVALAMANGGPLLAVAMEGEGIYAERARVLSEIRGIASGQIDPVATASRWATLGMAQTVRVLTSLVQDLVCVRLAGAGPAIRHTDILQGLQSAAERLDLQRILGAYDLLTRQWQLLSSGANVREQDMLEEFAIHLAER
jgi:DNA polymerase-3 subunit delta'